MNLTTRRFRDEDAKRISEIVRRNFMEVNIEDYPEEEMRKLCEAYDEEKVRQVAGYAHMYVVLQDEQIVGTGSISSFWGSPDESILLTIFVLPELHGNGIGREIIRALEEDELFLRAKRVEIPSSITAHRFYQKFGYDFKEGQKVLDDEGLYRMEKFR